MRSFFARWGIVTVVGAIIATTALAPAAVGASTTATGSTPATTEPRETQSLTVDSAVVTAPVVRDSFKVEDPPPPPPPPPPPAPEPETYVAETYASAPRAVSNPSGAQAIAADLVAQRGWGAGEFNCLVALWERESNWNAAAYNASSGATGIPQALPGSKMASAGADWATNPATQIRWGLGYIADRYGAPCGAWAHSENNNWY